MTPFAVSGLLAGSFSLLLGIFVFWKSPDKKIGKIWFLFALSVAGWGFGSMWMGLAKSPRESVLAARVAYYIGIVWIAPLFYHFIYTFLGLKPGKFLLVHYLIAIAFLPVISTGWFFLGAGWLWDTLYYPRGGAGEDLFFIWWAGLVVYSHILLSRLYEEASPLKKNQIKYFFLATAVGFGGGSLCYLPNFGIHIYPWGNFTVFLYPIIMSYAILKHQLLDINIVIRKALIYSLLSAVLAAIYVGTITLIVQALGNKYGSVSAFSSALAAIFITLLFNPIRVRIQRIVDTRFFREVVDKTLLRHISGAFVHEIKTPLANIALPAELTLMDLEDLEVGRKSIQDLIPKIRKRMKYILDQALLAGSKVDAVREATVYEEREGETFDLKKALDNSLVQMGKLLQNAFVNVEADIPPTLVAVPGSARQMEIVFVNLIKNAAEAMDRLPPKRPRNIRIQAGTDGRNVIVDIKDTGPGVSSADAQRIFESHYSTKNVEGAGVGLYMCKQIMHGHSGSISLVNTTQGALFRIILPLKSSF